MSNSAVHPVSVTLPQSPQPDVPVAAELRFDSDRPYAACLAFPVAECGCADEGLRLCWYFSRDLLNEGRHAPAGLGDVEVRPGGPGSVLITLQGPDGHAVLSAPTDTVAAFLAECFALVPAGSETDHLDIDGILVHLLDGDGPRAA
ncbi:SsgA family sporulation/cell division regulator [Kitasatospora sp. NPDC048365]|uniref:SsgA family sporulation/cell division regulator n=1 Tax=Kitasatospora sp. NPDC048365 TaxID=3364050 RepID=UPI003715F6F3